MIRVTVTEARVRLAKLLAAAQSGQSIEVTRRGKTVARIVPPKPAEQLKFPDLTEFRASLGRLRRHAKATIAALRSEDRY